MEMPQLVSHLSPMCLLFVVMLEVCLLGCRRLRRYLLPHERFRLSSFCASSSKMLIGMRIIKTESQLAKVARVMQTSSTTGSDLFLNL